MAINMEEYEVNNEVINEEDREEDSEMMLPTNTEIPEDIQEAEDRCNSNPIAWLIGGGILAGVAIAAGVKVIHDKVKAKRSAMAEDEAAEDLEEVSEEEGGEIEEPEPDIHPEIPSQKAKELCKGKSQRKKDSGKKKKKK